MLLRVLPENGMSKESCLFAKIFLVCPWIMPDFHVAVGAMPWCVFAMSSCQRRVYVSPIAFKMDASVRP